MHVPQSLQTRYELEWITLVPTQIFTPQGGQGIISLVFDSLTGMYRFTRGNKPMSKDMIQNLLMVHPHWNGKVLPADMSDGTEWSPSAMYSMILPEFSYKGKNMAYGNDPIPENEIVIEKGLVRHGGIFDKKVLGTGQDAMMKTIAFWYGNWAAKNYIDSTQQLVNDWLSTSGLSVGIGDVIAPPDILERITQEVRTGIHNVNQILSQAHHGLLEPNLQSKYFFDALELKVRNALKVAEDKITKILEEFLSPENRFLEMIACGGRGSKVNLMQTTGVVGQQITDNSRTKFHYTARTLPHFTKDDFGAESRGFVMHSFTQGLAPHEFFFHQMSSREGTIDTAIKSVSGDTPIILIENDNARYVEIGEWIDNLLKQYPEEIEKHPEHNQELLKTKAKTLIPTTDEFGKIHWGEVTAVTRHDPGQKMYQVKTQSGREVKVVESKSLIIWDEALNQFKEVPTSSVQVGDFLPVSLSLPNTQESNLNDTTIQEMIQRQMKNGCASIQLESQEEMNKIVYYCARHGLWTILEPYKIQIQENPSQEYRIVENVVLDPIVSIEELDVNDYPKVYDITVPSTLNFGLANGLQVRDTADVGYIQRRLIKAMEDIHVAYDLTLRTAAKTILQFRYGDDGYEPTKIQKQNLDLFDKSYTQMRKDYEITDAEWATWEKMLAGDMKKQWKKNQQNEKEVAQKAYEELVQIQRRLREVDFKYAPSVEFAKTFNCPVHFPRLIQKIKDFHPMGGAIELLPSEVQRTLDTVIQELRAFMPDMTLHRFEAQLRSMISVKRCVLSERWSRDAFANCIQQVKEYFLKGICQPGEMIGTLTAEMIGEPLTQLTLNSVDWNTEIILNINGNIVKYKIGEWIDDILPKCVRKESHPNDTTLGYIDDMEILVPACTEDGKIIWDKVQAVTKHPVINKDGSNTLLKVMTRSGREVIATKAKSFLQRVQNKIIGVDGDTLQVGGYIPYYTESEDSNDTIPNVVLSDGTHTIYRKNLETLISKAQNDDDKKVLQMIQEEDIYYDEIISIEEIPTSHPYVYDLTVEKTKNFNIANGLCMRDTFHLAGRGDTGSVTTTGVPRMKEIVNLAKDIKTPSMTLFLKEPWRSDINRAKELKSILEYTKLGDLVIQSRILFDPLAKALETEENQHRTSGGIDFEEEDEFTRLYYSFAEAVGFPAPDPQTSSPWVLRMEFDRDKMVARNITMADIRRVLTMNQELNQDIEISFSDDNAGDLVMRVRVSAIQEDTDPISFLQTLEHKHLMQVTIQGIQGIQRCSVENEYSIFYDADGKPEMKKENVIKTIGVNVFEVLMMDFIDAERMLCNDIHTVKEIFGIEAARSLLLHEFGVLLSGSVPDLNYRHISVVCDVMAYRGDLMSIDRHGLKRSPDISPFAKASNEESVEILVNAGVFADTDRMTGVSSNILMGQEPVGGTNAFELLLDESQLVEKMEVQMPDHSPDTLYEEVGEATTWGAEDEEDVVEEVVEVANPEYQGFLADDPFTVQWDGDRLDRLGRLEVETTVPRPPLFKSTENWIQKDE